MYKKVSKAHCENTFIYLTIIEDVDAEFVINKFSMISEDECYMTSILYDIIYSIYIMNDKLHLMHNAIHFKNILIKTVPQYIKTYCIDKITFTRQLDYKLYIDNFELSNLLEHDKHNIVKDMQHYGLTDDKTSKDIWTVLNSLLYIDCVNKTDFIKNALGEYSDTPSHKKFDKCYTK